MIKARCGADVSLDLTDRTTGQAVLLPEVTLKLYVVSGHNAGAVAATEPPGGLYLSGGCEGSQLVWPLAECPKCIS